MPGRGRIRWLVIAHVACGILCLVLLRRLEARLNADAMPAALAAFYGFVLSELSLLGSWAAYGRSASWKRLIGLATGAIYLDALLRMAGMGDGFPAIPVAAFAVAGLSLLAPRRLIRPEPVPTAAGPDHGVRFSIRGLMLVTLVAALLLAAIQGLADSSAGIVVPWFACFLAVGWVTPHAALGLGPPAPKCLAVLSLSAGLGALFVWRIYRPAIPAAVCVAILSAFLIQAVLLIASLLVVRSSGYRLVATSQGAIDRPDEAPPLDVERIVRDIGS